MSNSVSEYDQGYSAGFAAARLLMRSETTIKTLGNITFDSNAQVFYYCGKAIKLTKTHRSIMELLMTGRLITKDQFHSWLWPLGDDKSHALINCHLSNLRNKLVANGCPKDILITEHASGWRLNPHV